MPEAALSVCEPSVISLPNADSPPIVIVGNGPAGMEAARQLLARRADLHLVIYGAECHPPYNRVRLSSVLAGELGWDGIADQLVLPAGARVEQRLGYRVAAIDYQRQLVIDAQDRVQPYGTLIIATGSSPHVPNIAGIGLAGVYTFRSWDDAESLMARRVRSHHTVVLGGGLLGLEAARAMQRNGTQVTVVEHADRLMGNQLDLEGSRTLAAQVGALGIELVVGDGVRQVLGDIRVAGLQLQSGARIACDTVIVATGIRPNTELAQTARIAWGQGIRVDDNMRTSAKHVYAIGECAEHRGRIYGLVGPGLEQARVAASHILGKGGSYQGSLASTRLKVVGCDVFSMGPMAAHEERLGGKRYIYRDSESGVYRTLLIRRHRLQGVIAIGCWDDTQRMQSAVADQALIWPWQRWRFVRTGSLWPEGASDTVATWPATALVCQCMSVSRGQLSDAMAAGADSVVALRDCTGASSVCGSCKPLLEQLLGSQNAEPMPWHRWLLAAALVSVLGALAFLVLPRVPYADTVQLPWRWDLLWRDGVLKQISGFTVLSLFTIGLLLSPRKRIKAAQALGSFDLWRLGHVALGVLVMIALLAHTGLRLGEGLNLLLMVSFVFTLLLGGVTTGVIAVQHRIGMGLARTLRRQSLWWHILWFWPVPVALGFHILKSYWY